MTRLGFSLEIEHWDTVCKALDLIVEPLSKKPYKMTQQLVYPIEEFLGKG